MCSKFLLCALLIFLLNLQQSVAQEFFGEKFSPRNAMTASEVADSFNSLRTKDTVNMKISTKVKSVCKMKGCWMVLEVPGEEVRVTFKDYGFFVPKDIEGRQVVVSGKAFLSEISVEDQQHFAEDEGKGKEEIEKITMPRLTRTFVAHGVVLKE